MEQTFRSVVYGRIIIPMLFIFIVNHILLLKKQLKKRIVHRHIHELFIGEKQLQLIIVMHTLGV